MFKNQKVRIISWGVALVGMVSFGVFVQSCSQDDDEFLTKTMVDSQKANIIASQYIELENNQYILNLSEEKAMSLGISKIDYGRMQEEVFQANAFIIECKENGIEVAVNDPRDIQIDIPRVRLKSDSEQDVSAVSFTLYDTHENSGSKDVPDGYKKVEIVVAISCLLGSASGKVVCGGTPISWSITGVSGGSKTVDLPYSKTNMTITGQTFCSGGGYLRSTFKYQ